MDKFNKDLEIGQQGEELLKSIALSYCWKGEKAVEVKNDTLVATTGNLFVECEYRGRASGIAASPALWWAFVADGGGYNREIIILVKASRLKEICARHPKVQGGDRRRVRGYLIPITELVGGQHEQDVL